MRPIWHPLSALLLPDAPSFASPALVRVLVGGPLSLRYAGDRMWPTVRHGDKVECLPPGGSPGDADELLVVSVDGVPDLLRVVSRRDGSLVLRADADPAARIVARPSDVLARTHYPAKRVPPLLRALRRIRLDAREAWREGVDEQPDDAATVRDKYDSQARFYAGAGTAAGSLPAASLDCLRDHVPPGARILVAGSGTGRECFQLAGSGWSVTGVDFSPKMVESARAEAARRGAAVEFRLADLRRHAEPDATLGAVVFTYDVYSFLPDRTDRVDLLRRMARFLTPGGVILLSARRLRRIYEALGLSVQFLAARRRGEPRRWGATHTRWIAPDGRLARSFVQVFPRRVLDQEILEAGLRPGPWLGGHRILLAAG